jgi:DNA primase
MAPSAFGVARGFAFGDGTRLKKGTVAYLYGDKDQALLPFFPRPRISRDKATRRLAILGLPAYFKQLPPLDESPPYLYGWLSGYFAADGHVSDDTLMLDSADREHLEFVRVLCDRLGIGTYGISRFDRPGFASPGSRSAMYRLRFVASDLNPEFFVLPAHRERFENFNPAYARRRWTVKQVVRPERADEVFCAQVPGTHAFALEDNILTGNCFGCNRGGRIFDLASLLIGGPWGIDLRGDAFRAARTELERRLGVPIKAR